MTPLTGEGRRSRDYYRKVAELGVQAAEALDHAHLLGIVHRDIKPANLLLDGRGKLSMRINGGIGGGMPGSVETARP